MEVMRMNLPGILSQGTPVLGGAASIAVNTLVISVAKRLPETKSCVGIA
jgi:hypothetical protein